MPTLRIVPRGAGARPEVAQEIVDEYKALIEQGDTVKDNLLEFGPKEDIKLGKKALAEAANQLGVKLRISKARGVPDILRFRFLTGSTEPASSPPAKAKRRPRATAVTTPEPTIPVKARGKKRVQA